MTCGLAGFFLVLLLVPSLLPAAGVCDPDGQETGSAIGLSDESATVAESLDPSSEFALGCGSDCETSANMLDRVDLGPQGADECGCRGGGDRVASDPWLGGPWPLGVPLFLIPGRVQKERLLEHRLRRQIVEAVRNRPGIHYRELLRALGVSNGTLAYHLKQLERAGYLRFSRAHGRKLLWVAGDEIDTEFLLITDRDRELLALLTEDQGSRIAELGPRCGLKTSGVEYHIDRLRSLGLVQAHREGHALALSRAPLDGGTPKVCTTNHSPA